jgi:integrase
MKWADVAIDGTWIIDAAEREKGNAGEVVLPPVAVDIIRSQPHVGDNPHVFAAARGNGHMSGYSKLKKAFDAKLPDDMPQWQLHDLRRSARSLMSRAGVAGDIAERTLGHAQAGVRGVYDRHAYAAEKADALKRLAALIDGIVHERANVVPIQKRKRKM